MSRLGQAIGLGFATFVLGLAPQMVAGQQLKPLIAKPATATPAVGRLRPDFNNLMALPTNRNLERKIEAVKDYIESSDWREVTKALQDILDYPQDAFMPVTRPGSEKTHPVWISIRVEANRLLGSLPAKGREVYQVLSGARAAAMLQAAKRNGDPERLAEVAERYFHTQAGAEATDLLGTHHLDRGRYLMAASCFNRLLQRPETPPLTIFKAALAANRAGDQVTVGIAWKRLAAKAPDGLTLGDRQASLDDLKKVLDRPAAAREARGAAEWPVFGGDFSRNGRARLLHLTLERKWSMGTVEEASSKQTLESAVRNQQARNQPVLPGSFPIAVAGKVMFRNQRGIQCVNATSGEVIWESTLNGGLDNPLHLDDSSSIKDQVHSWANMHAQQNPQVLLENSTLGTLSSDGQRVFAVEDVCVPPMTFNPYMDGRLGMRAAMMMNINGAVMVGGMQGDPNNRPVAKDVNHNQLVCIDAETGRTLWTLGRCKTRMDGVYFLGPPLPLNGKLYGLAEKDQELRLMCLEPHDGKVVWTQPLANFSKGIEHEAGRRTWAAHLAYGEGVLVCPSHSGAVIAVDLLSHSLLWAHSYAKAPPSAPKQKVEVGNKFAFIQPFQPYMPRLAANWRNSAPIIADGKVLITAPDAGALHCLNLRDGSLLWKVDWTADDCYVAGAFEGKVLIVGKQVCRALNLVDGKRLWSTPTGALTGHGVAAGNIYYLPVREGRSLPVASLDRLLPANRLCGLDINTGKILRRTDLPQNVGVGNLLFYRDRLVSQTISNVSAFAAQ
jgi:outer membrane protein assembly factor BamB